MTNSSIVTKQLKTFLGCLFKKTTLSLKCEESSTNQKKKLFRQVEMLSAAMLAKWRKDNAQDMHIQACWVKNRFQMCFQKHSLQNSQVYLSELLVPKSYKKFIFWRFSSLLWAKYCVSIHIWHTKILFKIFWIGLLKTIQAFNFMYLPLFLLKYEHVEKKFTRR